MNISTDGCTPSEQAEPVIVSTEREREGRLFPPNEEDNDEILLVTNTRALRHKPIYGCMEVDYMKIFFLCQFVWKNTSYWYLKCTTRLL